MRNSPRLTLVVLTLVSACSAGADTVPGTTVHLQDSPKESVENLHAALVAGDFEAAGRMTIAGHAALASLAEGAKPAQVVDALQKGDSAVATNFWSGFAQGAGEAFLGDVDVRDIGPEVRGQTTFHLVEVVPVGLASQRLVTQDQGGQLVDLFASFGSALAERMILPVQGLVEDTTPDGMLILGELNTVVDSLLLASTDPGLTPESVQSILQLVELITRVG